MKTKNYKPKQNQYYLLLELDQNNFKKKYNYV